MADIASPGKSANMPKKRTPSVANSAKTIERKPSEAPASVVSHAKSKVSAADTQPVEEGDEDEYEEEEEEDDGTEEAFPAGTIDHKGDVVDDSGKVIGHALGDNISSLEGSIVDQDGDVLDKEGNIVGSADLLESFSMASKPEGAENVLKKPMQDIEPTPEESASQVGGPTVGEAKSQLGSAVNGEKSELVAPFGVQDNGEITNATGDVVGQLTEGSPQELVGTSIKEIDKDGNLKVESGSVIGQGEIPELLEHDALTGSAVSQLDDKTEAGSAVKSKVDGAKSAVGSQVPTEKAASNLESKVDKSLVDRSVVNKSVVGSQIPEEKVGSAIDSKLDAKSAIGSQAGSKLDVQSAVSSQAGSKVDYRSVIGSQVGDQLDAKSAVDSEAPGEDLKVPEEATSQVGDKLEESKSVAGFQLPEGGDLEVRSRISKRNGISVVGSQLPKAEDLEVSSPISKKDGTSVIGSQLPEDKTDIGSQLPESGDLPEEPKFDAEGKPIETSEEPKVDANRKPIESPDASKLDAEGNAIEETPSEPQIDAEGNIIPESEREQLDEGVALPEEVEKLDLSILKGKKVNKIGKLVDENGTPFGQVAEGDIKKLLGKKADADGNIWDDIGKIIGRAELLPEDEREAEPSAPFEDFPDSIVDSKGNVIFEDKVVGKLTQGDAKKLEGKKVDADGDVLDKNGNVLGKAERYQEEEAIPELEEPEPVVDRSLLEGKKVNKAGNVVDDHGKLFGHVVTGILAKLVGRKCDKDGNIWGEAGKVIGSAELIPAEDRDEQAISEFEDFPGAVIDRHGNVIFGGQVVGKLIEGDARKLIGKKIDQDGEVVDRLGNVLGKAERWIEEDAVPEPEPEPEPVKVDLSALAGKRVNKAGNIVDGHGDIYGILVEGDANKLAGRMCDKNGHVFDEGGNIVGRAELVPESERSGQREGPFSGFASPTVTKDGKVADVKGTIIGRLVLGDAKVLYGKEVDPDGDILDKNGNTLGKAERWEEEEKPKAVSPVEGRKVNREGNVVNEDGDLIAKLTEGDVTKCAGKEIDADGDVYNSKNQVIGHVTLLEEIPEPVVEPEPEPEPVVEPEPEPEVEVEEETEPEETEEEKSERLEKEQDRRLAGQMAMCIQGSIDNIQPVLKLITEAIDNAERQPKEELDEQKLVDTVKPLIEQGHAILMEARGVIRGLDPDGHIAAQSKGRAGSKDASPEEYRLAELLKELTGNVHNTIENAKKKISGMPHAKKELNPLWGLLAEPLGQILAAVGLLLAGVLGLVGRLLSTLGLGGLLDNLLGGLGLKGILKGLGLGMVTESLTGKK